MRLDSLSIKDILKATAGRSVATKMKVGAILIKDGEIIKFGYNKAPVGFAIEDDNGKTIDQNAIHAEMSIVYDSTPDDLLGSYLYCTHSPCKSCALALKAVGVESIYYVAENKRSSAYPILENPLNLTLVPI